MTDVGEECPITATQANHAQEAVKLEGHQTWRLLMCPECCRPAVITTAI